MQWWTVEPKQWLDASSLVVYASMAERVTRNGEDVGIGFGTDLLVTLKFDDVSTGSFNTAVGNAAVACDAEIWW